MITIFTPTYNRAYIIQNLYDSLLRQTNKNFEWLVVDDGSTDNTEVLINGFIEQQKINIRYIKQQNGGKHRAINRGVKEAKGELIFIVDSDDYLADNAIEKIYFYYKQIENDDSFCGVCGLRCFPSGERVGGESNFKILDCSSLDFRLKHKITGDMAEVFKTNILKQYSFPEYENEKFCPEALVWNRIADKYKFRYFYEKIYICEYLNDGLTAKITKIRMQSALASMLFYAELKRFKIPFAQKIKAAINYWRFALCSKKSLLYKIKQIGFCSILLYPFGLIMHIRDKRLS